MITSLLCMVRAPRGACRGGRRAGLVEVGCVKARAAAAGEGLLRSVWWRRGERLRKTGGDLRWKTLSGVGGGSGDFIRVTGRPKG